ncbi:hypothetical protein GCM10022221_62940 [Actinocorallia aurea]
MAAAAALGFLSACSPAADDAPRSAGAGQFEGASVTGLQALHHFFPASAAQRIDGGKYLSAVDQVKRVAQAKCMAKAGFNGDLPGAPQADRETLDLVANLNTGDFPDLKWMAANNLIVPDVSFPDVPPPSTPEEKAEAAATETCAQEAEKLFPARQKNAALIDSWWTVVLREQASEPVRALLPTFRSCMEKEGADVSLVRTTASSEAFGGFLGWHTGLMASAADDAARKTLNERWVPIFVRCATPVMETLEGRTTAAQGAFFQDHFEAVQTLINEADQQLQAAEGEFGVTR